MAKKEKDELSCPEPSADALPVENLTGLALSGGGIRSASFNLGVLQGLKSLDALWAFDYLSTVSGGGFVGSWWSAWLSRDGRARGDLFPEEEELEPSRRQKTALLLDTGKAVPSTPDGSLSAKRSDPIHFLRLFSNYLTPKTGLFSPDTWRMIAFFMRSLVFTWAALLPLVLAAVMLAQSYYVWNENVAQSMVCPLSPAQHAKPPPRGDYCTAQLMPQKDSIGVRLRHVGTPAEVLLAVCATLALLWLAHSSARVGLALVAIGLISLLAGVLYSAASGGTGGGPPWAIILAVVATVAMHIKQSFVDYERTAAGGDREGARTSRATAADHRGWLTKQLAFALEYGLFALLLLLAAGFAHDLLWFLFSGDSSLLARAGGWTGLVATLVSVIYTGARASPSSDAKASGVPPKVGRLLIAIAPTLAIVALALAFAALGRNLLRMTLEQGYGHTLVIAAVGLAALEVLFAIFESYNDPLEPLVEGFTWRRFVPDFILRLIGQHRDNGEKRPWYFFFSPRGWARIGVAASIPMLLRLVEHRSLAEIWTALLAAPTSLVAILILAIALTVTFARRSSKLGLDSARPAGLLILASLTATLCLVANSASDHAAFIAALLWVSVLVGGVIGIGWLADPNLLSMHAFYKGRLVRAYLGASNITRENDEITDSAPGDDVKLTGVWNHDIGAPYHLVNTTLNLVGGSDLAMAQRSAENFIMTRYHCGSARAGYRCTARYMSGELSLGTAAAISGAAASPVMGSNSPSAALTLLLSLLNVRLGFWAPTPSGRRWNEPHARLWPFYILRETLSNTGQIGTYCYLTDGGHFENTGLYSLVERACRYIVVCDCGADPKLGFDDIGIAVRRCRIDFGAEIDLRINDFIVRDTAERLARTHVVRGKITYLPAHLRMLGIEPGPATLEGHIVWIKPAVTDRGAADVRQYHRAHGDFPQQTTADQWYDESQFESYRRLGFESVLAAFNDRPAPARGRFDLLPGWFGF